MCVCVNSVVVVRSFIIINDCCGGLGYLIAVLSLLFCVCCCLFICVLFGFWGCACVGILFMVGLVGCLFVAFCCFGWYLYLRYVCWYCCAGYCVIDCFGFEFMVVVGFSVLGFPVGCLVLVI